MAFVIEETSDIKIIDVFSLKHEDAEVQTDLLQLKEESQEWEEMEEKNHEKDRDFKTGEKSFSCLVTKKVSSQTQALKTETRSLFICRQCGNSFTQKSSLNVHMRDHTGVSPFTCQQCVKQFSQKGNFNVHMKLHTGEKPFTCNICGKSFSLKGNLHIHMRIHTGEKPFTCDQCGKSFRFKVTLKTHMRTHSRKSCFKCHQCGRSFTDRKRLKKHVITHWREAFHVSSLWREFHISKRLETSYADSF